MLTLPPEPAPAKVNLYLHVVGRRADGYHLLDSLVVFADVADAVRVAPAGTLTLELAGPFGAALAGEPTIWCAGGALAGGGGWHRAAGADRARQAPAVASASAAARPMRRRRCVPWRGVAVGAVRRASGGPGGDARR